MHVYHVTGRHLTQMTMRKVSLWAHLVFVSGHILDFSSMHAEFGTPTSLRKLPYWRMCKSLVAANLGSWTRRACWHICKDKASLPQRRLQLKAIVCSTILCMATVSSLLHPHPSPTTICRTYSSVKTKMLL